MFILEGKKKIRNAVRQTERERERRHTERRLRILYLERSHEQQRNSFINSTNGSKLQSLEEAEAMMMEEEEEEVFSNKQVAFVSSQLYLTKTQLATTRRCVWSSHGRYKKSGLNKSTGNYLIHRENRTF